MQNQVFNIFNAPKGKDAPHGEHIYEWEYFDDDGKVQKDKLDVHEKIQSYLSRVDYKAQIKRGELELDGNITGVNRDYTQLPGNTVDLYKYLAYLSTLSEDQVAKFLEQANAAGQDSLQTEQASDQTGDTGGQTDGSTV